MTRIHSGSQTSSDRAPPMFYMGSSKGCPLADACAALQRGQTRGSELWIQLLKCALIYPLLYKIACVLEKCIWSHMLCTSSPICVDPWLNSMQSCLRIKPCQHGPYYQRSNFCISGACPSGRHYIQCEECLVETRSRISTQLSNTKCSTGTAHQNSTQEYEGDQGGILTKAFRSLVSYFYVIYVYITLPGQKVCFLQNSFGSAQ